MAKNIDQQHADPKADGRNAAIEKEIESIDQQREKAVRHVNGKYRLLQKRIVGDKRENVTPWLVIRHAPSDLGLRPIPSGTAYWASPDIWVENQNGIGNPIAGQDNFLHAKIYNLGAADAAPVKVDFYWADPSLGLGASNMNYIGSEWVEVKSLRSKVVKCTTPWVPIFLNNGHECVMVNCSNHILDPIKQPFEPVLDRHVGQRNLHVEKAQAARVIKFQFTLNNNFPIAMNFRINARIHRLALKKDSPEITDAMLQHAAYFTTSPTTAAELKNRYNRNAPAHKTAMLQRKMMGKNITANQVYNQLFDLLKENKSQCKIDIALNPESTFVYDENASTAFGQRLIHHGMFSTEKRTSSNPRDFLLKQLDMKAHEQRKMDVAFTIPPDVVKNEVIVIHIEQETENISVGGYTCIFHITG